jgi:hypothetical protein
MTFPEKGQAKQGLASIEDDNQTIASFTLAASSRKRANQKKVSNWLQKEYFRDPLRTTK